MGHRRQRLPFDIVFANKQTNLTGLQLADLVARPVGVNYLRPTQANQAFELLKRKFYCDGGRNAVGIGYENVGLLIYPPQKGMTEDQLEQVTDGGTSSEATDRLPSSRAHGTL